MKLLSKLLLMSALAFMMVPAAAPAQTSLYTTATVIRAPAVLTTSDVISTFTLPARAKAVHVYVDFTKGSLTDATFAPAGARDFGNPASSGYFKSLGEAVSVTATGKYHFRLPRETFGAYQYAGVFAVGGGTPTSSSAEISIKYEY